MREDAVRRLAAIMFTDIVGYTALMQEDERRGKLTSDRHRETLQTAVERHNGKLLKHSGDGSLSIFRSAIDGVNCAIEIQIELQREPTVPLRIGVHTGDIVFDDDDVYGDGVNVASRIEGLASSGGVFMSDKVYDEVKNQPSISAASMGEFQLKNVKRAIEIYAVIDKRLPSPVVVSAGPATHAGLSPERVGRLFLACRRDKIAAGLIVLAITFGIGVWTMGPPEATGSVTAGADVIAVLPFQTSGEDVAMLAEGMVDLLTPNLDQLGPIRTVHARTVLHRWNQRATDGQLDLAGALAVGRDVAAGSVLLGSAVSVGTNVRLGATLRTVDGKELARVQVDGPKEDVLALVDSLSVALLREIWQAREPVPQTRVSAITTSDLDAIRAYLKGETLFRISKFDSAAVEFREAVEADSSFALAHYRLSLAYGYGPGGGFASPEALYHSAAAVRHAYRLPDRERRLVIARGMWREDPRSDAVLDSVQRHIELSPDDAGGWFLLGDVWFHQADGRVPRAELLEPFDRALKLDPTLSVAAIHPVQTALLHADRDAFQRYLGFLVPGSPLADALEWIERAVWEDPAASVEALRRIGAITTGTIPRAVQASYRKPDGDPLQWLPALDALRMTVSDTAVARSLAVQQAMILNSVGREEDADQFLGGLGLERLESRPREIEDANLTTGLARARLGHDAIETGDIARGIEFLEAGLLEAGVWGNRGWYQAQVPPEAEALQFELITALASQPVTRQRGIGLLRESWWPDFRYEVLRYFELGRGLEQAGDESAAREHYSRFLELVRGADSGSSLAPRITAARAALERLRGGREER